MAVRKFEKGRKRWIQLARSSQLFGGALYISSFLLSIYPFFFKFGYLYTVSNTLFSVVQHRFKLLVSITSSCLACDSLVLSLVQQATSALPQALHMPCFFSSIAEWGSKAHHPRLPSWSVSWTLLSMLCRILDRYCWEWREGRKNRTFAESIARRLSSRLFFQLPNHW